MPIHIDQSGASQVVLRTSGNGSTGSVSSVPPLTFVLPEVATQNAILTLVQDPSSSNEWKIVPVSGLSASAGGTSGPPLAGSARVDQRAPVQGSQAALDLFVTGSSQATKSLVLTDTRPSGLINVPIRIVSDVIAVDPTGTKVATARATELFILKGVGADAQVVPVPDTIERTVFDPLRLFTSYPQAVITRTMSSQIRTLTIQLRCTVAPNTNIEIVTGSMVVSAPEIRASS